MGNLCGQERDEQSSISQPKLKLSKQLVKTFINVLQGDPLVDQTMCFSNVILKLVNAAEDPNNTEFMKRNSSIPRNQLIPGTPSIIPFQQNNIKYLVQLKMPKDFVFHVFNQDATGEYDSYVQAFVDTFELCSAKNIECVTFTEPPLVLSRAKDFYAKIFFQAFQFYAIQHQNTKIKLIKIINIDLQIVDIYMKELLQVVVISQKQSTEVTDQLEQQNVEDHLKKNKKQIIESILAEYKQDLAEIKKEEIAQIEETKVIEDTKEEISQIPQNEPYKPEVEVPIIEYTFPAFDIAEYSRVTIQTLCEEAIVKLMRD